LRTAQVDGAGGEIPVQFLRRAYFEDEGQDVAEYAIMLGVVLVIVIGTVQLIGANSNNVFSSVASTITN
jgi:Flp pilus assembly pilin Flp